MSAVGKCSLPNRDNLKEPIHMQLCQKLKTFSAFLSGFSKSRLNFKYFQKNNDAHRLLISEATASQKAWLHICVKVLLQITIPKGTS